MGLRPAWRGIISNSGVNPGIPVFIGGISWKPNGARGRVVLAWLRSEWVSWGVFALYGSCAVNERRILF